MMNNICNDIFCLISRSWYLEVLKRFPRFKTYCLCKVHLLTINPLIGVNNPLFSIDNILEHFITVKIFFNVFTDNKSGNISGNKDLPRIYRVSLSFPTIVGRSSPVLSVPNLYSSTDIWEFVISSDACLSGCSIPINLHWTQNNNILDAYLALRLHQSFIGYLHL